MIIGEFGSIFCDSVGITASISSVPHELASVIATKSEIYGKLGINDASSDESLPEITILRNLELNFDFSDSVDVVTKNINYMRLSNLFLDLLIVNKYSGHTNIGGVHKEADNNYYLDEFIRDWKKSSIISTTTKGIYGSNSQSGSMNISCSILSHIEGQNMGRSFSTTAENDTATMNKINNVISECLMIRCIKSIELLIKKHKDSQYLSAENERLQPKLDKLQSKIMKFFELPDQSTEIAALKVENTKLKLQLEEYKKSVAELDELRARLNKLFE